MPLTDKYKRKQTDVQAVGSDAVSNPACPTPFDVGVSTMQNSE